MISPILACAKASSTINTLARHQCLLASRSRTRAWLRRCVLLPVFRTDHIEWNSNHMECPNRSCMEGRHFCKDHRTSGLIWAFLIARVVLKHVSVPKKIRPRTEWFTVVWNEIEGSISFQAPSTVDRRSRFRAPIYESYKLHGRYQPLAAGYSTTGEDREGLRIRTTYVLYICRWSNGKE